MLHVELKGQICLLPYIFHGEWLNFTPVWYLWLYVPLESTVFSNIISNPVATGLLK